MNVRPVSVDEAPFRPNRLKRSGRQRGGWVYLPEELLRAAGIGPGDEVEVMRYALVERTRRANGSERVRGRVILNLRLLGQHARRKARAEKHEEYHGWLGEPCEKEAP